MNFVSQINCMQIVSAFIVIIAIIDIIGSIPIIIQLRSTGRNVNAAKATLYSLGLALGFFFGGNWILQLFGVTIDAFAVAGAILIFFMALEMICDVQIFKNQGPIKDATMIPLVFPLLAGPGLFTTLISLRAMYSDVNIVIALVLNMGWVYIVIRLTGKVQHVLGNAGIYFIRKFFGVILLAIAVKLFTENLATLWQ